MIKSKKTIVSLVIMICSIILFLADYGVTGSLEPTSAPGPTMKTLDHIPPTWSQKLQCDTTACPRFELVLDGAGVLDKETGLVWEQSPSVSAVLDWGFARVECKLITRGGRKGWRLPRLEELASLVDGAETNPSLPSGHPFSGIQNSRYWAINFGGIAADLNKYAYTVDFKDGALGPYPMSTGTYYRWCVRGGQPEDASYSIEYLIK